MLKTILSISGKPGLYKLISQGKNMLIVESLVDKKRFPAYGNEKIISLGDIAMYTEERCMRGRFSYTFLFKSDWLSVSEHQSVFRSIGIHRNRFAAVNLLRQQLLGQVVQ